MANRSSRNWLICLAAFLLWVSLAGQAPAADKQAAPENCRAGNQGQPPPTASNATHKSSILLKWKASVPASSSPHDAVKGYYVYRRLPKAIYAGPLNRILIEGTTCTDELVQPGETYYYTTRAVSKADQYSKPAKEVKVTARSK